MLDFEVQRCTRRCHDSDRELQPGETFYSVLLPDGGDVLRVDYCEKAWEGPPEKSIGWWKSQMPAANSKKLNWAPSDVMLHFFEQIDGVPEKRATRYVLALLMIRRKILRLDDTTEVDGRETYELFCPKNEKQYQVAVASPTAEQIRSIQEELGQLLFADAK